MTGASPDNYKWKLRGYQPSPLEELIKQQPTLTPIASPRLISPRPSTPRTLITGQPFFSPRLITPRRLISQPSPGATPTTPAAAPAAPIGPAAPIVPGEPVGPAAPIVPGEPVGPAAPVALNPIMANVTLRKYTGAEEATTWWGDFANLVALHNYGEERPAGCCLFTWKVQLSYGTRTWLRMSDLLLRRWKLHSRLASNDPPDST